MNIQQYQDALFWVYDKLEATAQNPVPIIRWTAEDPVVLQQNWPIGVGEIPVGELTNSLECMVKVLNLILNKAPILTRVSLNIFDTYLLIKIGWAKPPAFVMHFLIQRGFKIQQMHTSHYLSV